MIRRDKIDFKLVNIAIIALTIYLMYNTGHLWMGVFNKIMDIVLPFMIGFFIAYAVYPIVQKLMSKKIPKNLAICIVLLIIVALFVFIGYVISTTCVSQISNLFSSIEKFIDGIAKMDFNINISAIQDTINKNMDDMLDGLTKYVSDGAINLVNSSIDFIGDLFIGIAAFVYFLIDMDKIRKNVKLFFKKRSVRTYKFVKLLDTEMKNYLSGLVQVMVISIFEYGIVYSIIGHPNAILLAIMAGVANFIPYFGGIANNIVAAITAFIISPALFVRTLIAFFILSTVDSYIINPHVYGKTNSIHPLLTIFALFAGGALFGLLGILISFPLAIFFVSLWKFYKEDISDYIEDLKDNKRKEVTE